MDSIVSAVIEKHKTRAEDGQRKYGVTMDRDDFTFEQWLIHAQEEAMDIAVYLEKMIQELRKRKDGQHE
jgi:hypothetical protein